MSELTNVTLHRDRRPQFPPKCVACHDRSDTTIGVTAHVMHRLFYFFLPIFAFFCWVRVKPPICHGCRFRFRTQRWGRFLYFALAVVGILFLFARFGSSSSKVEQFLFVIAPLAPLMAWDSLWPQSFDISAKNDEVTYEFASLEYAREFYELNREFVLRTDLEQTQSDGDSQKPEAEQR